MILEISKLEEPMDIQCQNPQQFQLLNCKVLNISANILFHKRAVEKSNQQATDNAERMKCKKFHICHQRNGREEKVPYIILLFLQEKKKAP